MIRPATRPISKPVMMPAIISTGGLLSFAVMVLCRRIKGLSTMSVSVAGGISHNIGQILLAVFVVKNLNLLFYLPVLMIAGIITGLLIGLVAGLIIPLPIMMR